MIKPGASIVLVIHLPLCLYTKVRFGTESLQQA